SEAANLEFGSELLLHREAKLCGIRANEGCFQFVRRGMAMASRGCARYRPTALSAFGLAVNRVLHRIVLLREIGASIDEFYHGVGSIRIGAPAQFDFA